MLLLQLVAMVTLLTSAVEAMAVQGQGQGQRQQVQKCTDVQLQCMGRTGCSKALTNYMLSCDDVIHGEVGHCTDRCRKALVSLLSSAERRPSQGQSHAGLGLLGDGFMTCDCQGDEFCMQQRQRLATCTRDVIAVMSHVYDSTTPIGCSLAEAVCTADTSCLTAIDFYKQHCKKLFQVTVTVLSNRLTGRNEIVF